MTLKLVAIGALGNMLGPSALHLKDHHEAKVLRILDRGYSCARRDRFRTMWQEQGCAFASSLSELVGKGDFDGVLICAGKNGDDQAIIATLVPLLRECKKSFFILHFSTVSCQFVRITQAFCALNDIDYVNYPLTGGALGAMNAKMLILACGNSAIYEKCLPMLNSMGIPKYFGEEVTLGAAVKLIGHVMVFSGLLGMTSAVLLQQRVFDLLSLQPSQAEFFDFLNQGAGGSRQWDVALRQGIANDNWQSGFLLQHAAVDVIYTIELMLQKQLPLALVMPLAEVSLLFSYLLSKTSDTSLTTQSILRLLATESREKIDAFISERLIPQNLLDSCVFALPKTMQASLLLDVKYS